MRAEKCAVPLLFRKLKREDLFKVVTSHCECEIGRRMICGVYRLVVGITKLKEHLFFWEGMENMRIGLCTRGSGILYR